jgi:hypothetical protein
MIRMELEQNATEDLLHLESGLRRQLATVLEEWLSTYAGIEPAALGQENFDLVVELRRVLLSPDERLPSR